MRSTGLGGGELDQKVVTTGNRTTLTDLSEAEIVLLQRLDPAIALAPGATTPFLIVFLEPPRELREFSSRVLSVRPTRRASTSPAGSSQGSVGVTSIESGSLGRLAEVADALAEPFPELGQPAGAEDDQDDHQDHQHLSHPQTEHAILHCATCARATIGERFGGAQ